MKRFEPTALVIHAPAIDGLVRSYRDRYDPSAKEGMPAHITLLFPFMPLEKMDGQAKHELADIFRRSQQFTYSISSVEAFPSTIYLAPDPVEPFVDLTQDIMFQFPEYPPYSGAYDKIIPHLTIADRITDQNALTRLKTEIEKEVFSIVPDQIQVNQASLFFKSQSLWKLHSKFDLGHSKSLT